MSAPLRVYRYRTGVVQPLLAEMLAAGSAAATILYLQTSEPIGSFFLLCFSVWSALRALRLRRQRRTRIWLYPDRVGWIGASRRWREARFDALGPPTSPWSLLSKGTGIRYATPAGRLAFDGDIEGYGDLTQRIEDARLGGSATRDLPLSTLPWIAPTRYSMREFHRTWALSKGAGAALLAVFVALFGSLAILLAAVPILLLAGSAMLDYFRYRWARIELVDDKLVQFNLWNQRTNVVDIRTLLYVSFHSRGLHPYTLLEGDHQTIYVDPRLEGAHDLVSHAYQIIADRQKKCEASPLPSEPSRLTSSA